MKLLVLIRTIVVFCMLQLVCSTHHQNQQSHLAIVENNVLLRLFSQLIMSAAISSALVSNKVLQNELLLITSLITSSLHWQESIINTFCLQVINKADSVFSVFSHSILPQKLKIDVLYSNMPIRITSYKHIGTIKSVCDWKLIHLIIVLVNLWHIDKALGVMNSHLYTINIPANVNAAYCCDSL